MIGRTTFASIPLLALALAACGSTVNDDDTASQGAGASTSSAASGTGGTGNASGTTGTGTGAGGGTCPGYEDQAGSGEVILHVVNNAPMPIYIPRNCDAGSFSVLGEDGKDWHQDLSCSLSCQELQTSPQIACGACEPSVHQVPSFGSVDLVWRGTGIAQVDMPDACYFDVPYQDTCSQVVAAPAQAYRIEVPAFAQCDSFDDAPCACTDGICTGAEASGFQGYHEPAQLAYPAQKAIDVVFETCAFGCPNEEEDDDPPQPGSNP